MFVWNKKSPVVHSCNLTKYSFALRGFFLEQKIVQLEGTFICTHFDREQTFVKRCPTRPFKSNMKV